MRQGRDRLGPVREVVRAAASGCMCAAILALAAVWAGLAGAQAGELSAVALLLCLWASLFSLILNAGRPAE